MAKYKRARATEGVTFKICRHSAIYRHDLDWNCANVTTYWEPHLAPAQDITLYCYFYFSPIISINGLCTPAAN